MSDRYERRFAARRESGKKSFIPFTLLGWPDRDRCFQTIRAMIESGVSALELGLAFSDPVADGPVIQKAAFETVSAGFRVRDAFALVRDARALDSDIPIGLLAYHNMVIARGADAFFAEAAASGVDGVLIADLPPEAAAQAFSAAKRYGVHLIFIISPLTDATRLQKIKEFAGGFLYVVSRLGITGVEERYDTQLQALLERARAVVKLPLCVGFGVSTPENARSMYALGADGVITGSRVIEIISRSPADFDADLRRFLHDMAAVE